MEVEANVYKGKGSVRENCGKLIITAKSELDAAILALLAERIIDGKRPLRDAIQEIATPTQGATA